ncbi:HNH endonuclease signature motif containing protein [Acinetobacter sp. Marseille-Q1618]|uniref:HNH endonuclease signature motif containing protein n=1 Tax=Acinetobacter sp. Marseille-Q1618 TaxID=2697502 RepID=UPI0015704946|nr:HNH endonuclease signature motif containing protein [Acinetobacter sp. Marseille-Q1618]
MKNLYLDLISDVEQYLHPQNSDQLLFKAFNHRCYFCDFHDEKFLEIHHLDGNHSNNNAENLVPACTLCHRTKHLSWVLADKAGFMGISHDLSQVNLNHLQRFILILSQHPDHKIRMYFENSKLTTLIQNIAAAFSRPNVDESKIIESVEIDFPNATQDAKEQIIIDRKNAVYVRQSLSSNDSLERVVNAMKLIKGTGRSFNKDSFFPFVLLFNENIFKKEQVEYYLSLDEFNPELWTRLYEHKLLKEIG